MLGQLVSSGAALSLGLLVFLSCSATASAEHDLVIQEVQLTDGQITPGAVVTISATIANLGSQTEVNIPLDCRLWGRTPIEPTRLASFAPAGKQEFSCRWTVPDYTPGPGDVLPIYLLVFFAGPAPGETSTADNIKTLRLVFGEQIGGAVPQHGMDEGKEVHQWIAYQASRYFADQIEGADIDAYLGQWNNAQGDSRNTFLEGTAAEDKGDRPPLYQSCSWALDCGCPYWNHFCAGADGNEIYTGMARVFPCLFNVYDSALEQASRIWPYAVNAYSSDKGLAFYYLGHVAHLLTDMTVPAHTHNDPHPAAAGDPDSYEETIASGYNFQLWFFNGGRSGDWARGLTLFADPYSLFYGTANYTEDYDSNDYDGDGPPYYYPSDYVSTWHMPGNVDKSNGIDMTEITAIGDDLMPYAMKRNAELIRLFYSQVDTTDPICNLTYPSSTNMDNPDILTSMLPFNVIASASDPESGIMMKSYRFKYSHRSGGTWSDWCDIDPSPTTSSVLFTPPDDGTLYRFIVYADNGGGRQGGSPCTYLLIDTSTPSSPAIEAYSDDAHSISLVSGNEYTYIHPHFHFSSTSTGSGVVGYYYYWGTNAGGDPTTWTTSNDYTESGLSSDASWYFRVRAKNAAGTLGDISTFAYDFRKNSDGDGIPDYLDNCPNTTNPDQADGDGDHVGDVCDTCPNTIPAATVDANGCPPVIPGDFDRDGDVDATDFEALGACDSGPAVPRAVACTLKDLDADGDVDQSDFGVFQRCCSGENNPADPNCAN